MAHGFSSEKEGMVMSTWIVVSVVFVIVVIAFAVMKGGKSSAATTLRLDR